MGVWERVGLGDLSPRSRRWFLWGQLAAVVVFFGVGGVWATLDPEEEPSRAAVGQCVRVDQLSPTTRELHVAECTDPAATLLVAARVAVGAACPFGNYLGFRDRKASAAEAVRCMAVNLRQGQCVNIPSDNGIPVPTTCEPRDGERRFTVAAVGDGTIDPSRCPGSGFMTHMYSQPQRLVCLKALGPAAR